MSILLAALAAVGLSVVVLLVVFFTAIFVLERCVDSDEGLGIVAAAATCAVVAAAAALIGGFWLFAVAG